LEYVAIKNASQNQVAGDNLLACATVPAVIEV
jgi:hypothetical protein